MQVEFKPINATSKEIEIIVPAEKVGKAYDKYLRKAVRDITVPGFRPGKAPLAMVERLHADKIQEYFLKDYVDEIFDEVVTEHDIRYLLFPEVKELNWEKEQDMTLKIEIEHEPDIQFTQLEGLTIPYQPQLLEDEVDKYLESLRKENGRLIDVEVAEANDQVKVELSFKHGSESFQEQGLCYAGKDLGVRSLEELVGLRTGDTLEAAIKGRAIKLVTRNPRLPLENEFEYPCLVMVNSVERLIYPELDDDFAKDMDFDSLEQMKAKISEDMSLHNEHVNINIKNNSVISKLYIDNNFDLPLKTIEYLAGKEAEKVDNPEFRKYYHYQYKMEIAQEMVSLFIMKNLNKAIDLDVSDEMTEEYITHLAILDDKSVEAYKEAEKEELNEERFRGSVKNYYIMRKIAQSSEFVIEKPEASKEIEEAQISKEETE